MLNVGASLMIKTARMRPSLMMNRAWTLDAGASLTMKTARTRPHEQSLDASISDDEQPELGHWLILYFDNEIYMDVSLSQAKHEFDVYNYKYFGVVANLFPICVQYFVYLRRFCPFLSLTFSNLNLNWSQITTDTQM